MIIFTLPLVCNDVIMVINLEDCMQIDRAHGEEASCISCYMKDNPGTTEEDALNDFNAMNSLMMKELNWELMGLGSNIPFSITCKKPAFDICKLPITCTNIEMDTPLLTRKPRIW